MDELDVMPNMKRPHVRTATDADADSAIDVLRRAITEICIADHQNDTPTLERWLRNKTPEHFRHWRSAADNYMVVSVIEETICGVGAIRQSGDLDLCYVHPGWQRQGIGNSLILAMESQARAWGVHNLRLISTVTARAFYERHGYVFLPEESSPGFGVLYDYRYTKILNKIA